MLCFLIGGWCCNEFPSRKTVLGSLYKIESGQELDRHDLLIIKTMRLKKLEAWVGIEPTNKGFADPCLTTWLPRLDLLKRP